ncbi:F-box domain-containing protein [Purpureocillium lavendulum]|uniref:F-box domain-containing protein n=1 Tax=Purpureocillium lavendulum TaxID=1247861 RepID=A0AB34G9A6_9HYPO|nr:F-box domain-containing protein [Purpureocillium lavendulum]
MVYARHHQVPASADTGQILAAALSWLSSRQLVLVTSVSRRFHSVAARVLYRRLMDAASLPEHELILECYHPSAKISTPYLACRFLGTKTAGKKSIDEGAPRLDDLPKMYSSFRPVQAEENRRRRLRPDWPQQSLAMPGGQSDGDDESAVQEVYLDEGELFSQLCTVTNVVKESSRRGFYLSHINTCDGVIRIWRDWLAQLAASTTYRPRDDDSQRFAASASHASGVEMDKFLWVDPARTVGVRFSNKVMPSERMPLLSGPGDDEPVSYSLVYEELLVRSTTLLFAVEASAVQEVSRSSKAVVIAQYGGSPP